MSRNEEHALAILKFFQKVADVDFATRGASNYVTAKMMEFLSRDSMFAPISPKWNMIYWIDDLQEPRCWSR